MIIIWKKNFLYKGFFALSILYSIGSCSDNHNSINVRDSAGDNNFQYYKKKYSKAILYYDAPKDSLKLKALYFILKNLKDQYYLQGRWIDGYDNSIIHSKNLALNDLIFKLDSVHKSFPSKLDTIKDESIIDDWYLIDNINRAFESRKYNWVRDLSFNDFCEYVLPYKVGNEKPESWGACLKIEKYLNNDSLIKINNMFEATSYINNRLDWYKGSLNYEYPIDIGYKMSRVVATGTCYSMSRVALFQMRSLGLPGVIDYAPSWGNRSEGHYWNALIFKHQPYPFDPTGPNIGFYKIEFKGIDRMSYKISKVFRKTFAIQKNSLNEVKASTEEIPTLFKTSRIKDVTNEYVPVSNVRLNYSSHLSSEFAYLYTFNDRKWIPSFWAKINGNTIVFTNMGRDIVYLPALYTTSELHPIGNPFILKANGKAIELKANTRSTQTMTIYKKYPEDETNNIVKGNEYELFYWEGNWKSLGTQIAVSNKLVYSKSPTNALFWIRNLTEGKQERIFTFENGKQIWW